MRVVVETQGTKGGDIRKSVQIQPIEGETFIDSVSRAVAQALKESIPTLGSAGSVLASIQVVSSHGNATISLMSI